MSSGCALPSFKKEGATERDMDRERMDCEIQANAAGAGRYSIPWKNWIVRCMENKGWSEQ